MYLVPCQPTDFAITHGTGKSQVHCDIKFHVVTFIQSLPYHVRRPDGALFVVCLGLVCMGERVPCDNFPFYCLLESTPEYLMDTVDSSGCKVFTLRFSVFLCNGPCFLQTNIELIHIFRGDVPYAPT